MHSSSPEPVHSVSDPNGAHTETTRPPADTAAAPRPRTRAQREAARRNGRRSRGPISAAGKARSRLNALKHGILARTVPLGDLTAYHLEDVRARLEAEHQPVSDEERRCIGLLANVELQLGRAQAARDAVAQHTLDAPDPDGEGMTWPVRVVYAEYLAASLEPAPDAAPLRPPPRPQMLVAAIRAVWRRLRGGAVDATPQAPAVPAEPAEPSRAGARTLPAVRQAVRRHALSRRSASMALDDEAIERRLASLEPIPADQADTWRELLQATIDELLDPQAERFWQELERKRRQDFLARLDDAQRVERYVTTLMNQRLRLIEHLELLRRRRHEEEAEAAEAARRAEMAQRLPVEATLHAAPRIVVGDVRRSFDPPPCTGGPGVGDTSDSTSTK